MRQTTRSAVAATRTLAPTTSACSCALPASMLFPERSAPADEPITPGGPGTPVRVAHRDVRAARPAAGVQASAGTTRPSRWAAPRLALGGLVTRLAVRRRLTAGLDWLDGYWDRRDADASTRYHGGW